MGRPNTKAPWPTIGRRQVPPPRHLKAESRKLWETIVRERSFDDAASMAILTSAIEAFQRAAEARRVVDKEGVVVRDRFGVSKAHPAVAIERDARTAFVSAMRSLGLCTEPGQ